MTDDNFIVIKKKYYKRIVHAHIRGFKSVTGKLFEHVHITNINILNT